ncbi:MAG: lipocalin-like domain-containing protein [Gemmatimonadetes bacterium]|nr:lipocalin-like domain-containing protein [Gemmatimonadota bacterium]
MRHRNMLGIFAILGATACASQPAAERSPLEGAWRFSGLETVSASGDVTETPVYENLLLFTGHHYSLAFSRGETKSPPFADTWVPNDEEAVARLAAIVVNTGTYEVAGTNVTTTPVFAIVPSYIGGRADFEFSISGDTLTMTLLRVASVDGVPLPAMAEGAHDVYTLVRVE